jgi:tripartite-type tricarboxylate transporter receptor subunit TctC
VLVQYMEKLKKREGIDVVRVPFRSGNEVVNAIMTGSTPIAFLGLANMLPQIKAGHITGIALNAYERSPLFPDIPTLKEATGEDVPPTWFGLFAPAGTPQPIVRKVHAEVARITGNPAWKQKNFVDRAIEYAVTDTASFARFVAESRRRAGEIAKEAGIQPQ